MNVGKNANDVKCDLGDHTPYNHDPHMKIVHLYHALIKYAAPSSDPLPPMQFYQYIKGPLCPTLEQILPYLPSCMFTQSTVFYEKPLFFIILLSTILWIYGLRGLYFAIMQEGKIPVAFTGTAVGVISILGYTPDIFMGPINGYLSDRSLGLLEHQHIFMALCRSD